MKSIRTSFLRLDVRTAAALGAVAGAVGCSSLLNINNDRPYVDPDGGTIPTSNDGGGHPVGDDSGSTGPTDSGGGGTPETGPAGNDAGPGDDASEDAGPTFANPLQVDVRSLFNSNTIVTTADGGIPLFPMDGVSADDNNDFPTQSFMTQIGQSTTFGLPDEAVFPSTTPDVPNLKLWWTNDNNLNYNSLVVSSASGMDYTFALPPQSYSQVQLYATGAAGASTLNYTLTYKDGQVPQSVAIADWCTQSMPVAGQFTIASVYRIEDGTMLDSANPTLACHIFAINLNPDSGRILENVSFQDEVLGTGSTANFVFYGATAWR